MLWSKKTAWQSGSYSIGKSSDALLNMIQRLAEDKIHGKRSGTGQIGLNLNGDVK